MNPRVLKYPNHYVYLRRSPVAYRWLLGLNSMSSRRSTGPPTNVNVKPPVISRKWLFPNVFQENGHRDEGLAPATTLTWRIDNPSLPHDEVWLLGDYRGVVESAAFLLNIPGEEIPQ